MRPLSEATSRVSSKNFSKKYIALGRLVNQWEEIIGEEFAGLAQPVKMHYRKKKDKQTVRLDIATSAAYSTILAYRKDLILQRINQIFGNNYITEIKFVTSALPNAPPEIKKTPSPLTKAEKNDLSELLKHVEDEEFRQKLESFGKAFYQDQKAIGQKE